MLPICRPLGVRGGLACCQQLPALSASQNVNINTNNTQSNSDSDIVIYRNSDFDMVVMVIMAAVVTLAVMVKFMSMQQRASTCGGSCPKGVPTKGV